MSQIVHGYAVTSELLDVLAESARQRDYKSFWTTLNLEGVETEPAYSYSGTVAGTMLELLQEKGWTPVIDSDSESAVAIAGSEVGLEMCCGPADADESLSFVRSLSVSDEELAAYYREFWGEEWDEAVLALREALSYLETTLALIPQRGDWALLFIG
ncbi:MAG TPA: hypothetical protein VGQ41_11915 [Pyrinomonadaceae bacterium]|jgi:hypothetical protein|nr:hypothetical protein [Pyrinomonadaceae bacterium]